MWAKHNRRRRSLPSPEVISFRNGFVSLGYEGFLLLAVIAAVLIVAPFLRNQEHEVDQQGETRHQPIVKVAVPAESGDVFAQCGSSQIFSVNCTKRTSVGLRQGEGVFRWEISSDGRVLMTSFGQRIFSVIVNGDTVIDQQQADALLHACAMSPDGLLVAAVLGGQFVRCWNLKTGEVTDIGLNDRVENLALDSRSWRLYVNTGNRQLERYQIQSAAQPEVLLEKLDYSKLSLTCDQKWMIFFQGHRVTVREIDPFSERWTWQSDRRFSCQFATSHDSQSIAIARQDGLLLVKKVSTGETAFEWFNPDWQTTSLCFTSSDDGLVLGQKNGSLIFWPLRKQTIVPAPISVYQSKSG